MNQNNLQNEEDEDYTFMDKLGIIIFWFYEFKVDTDLKERGLMKKYKSKRICILIGILLYSIVIILANKCFINK